MILSDRSMCIIPHQGIGSPLSSLFLIRLFGGAQDREWKEAYMFHIYCKVKNRTQQRKQVIQSDQDVHVCRIFLDGTRTPFYMTLSFILRYGLSFFSFFFSFFAMLLGTDVLFFCIAHIFLQYEESCQRDGAFLCGCACFCVTSSVEVSIWVTG